MRFAYLVFSLCLIGCKSTGTKVGSAEVVTLELKVKQYLGSKRKAPEITMLDQELAGPAYARTLPRGIVLGTEVGPAFSFYLTHELVHWYGKELGLYAWQEEGLAHYIALKVVNKLEYLGDAPDIDEQEYVMSLSTRESWRTRSNRAETMRVAAYLMQNYELK